MKKCSFHMDLDDSPKTFAKVVDDYLSELLIKCVLIMVCTLRNCDSAYILGVKPVRLNEGKGKKE